jgi:hypothetical protein
MNNSVKQIAKILASHSHLHIVQIFGQFGKDFKIFSLVMEHMHQDLQSYLEDGVNNSLVLSNLPIAMDVMLQIVGEFQISTCSFQLSFTRQRDGKSWVHTSQSITS